MRHQLICIIILTGFYSTFSGSNGIRQILESSSAGDLAVLSNSTSQWQLQSNEVHQLRGMKDNELKIMLNHVFSKFKKF